MEIKKLIKELQECLKEGKTHLTLLANATNGEDTDFDMYMNDLEVWKDGEEKVIAQESWVVVKGSVECHFYDIDGTLLEKPILEVGDCSVTLAGGHTYLILEDDTVVYEYKTGPYKGQKMDKVFLDE